MNTNLLKFNLGKPEKKLWVFNREQLFSLAFYVLILCTILNGNEFQASIRFTRYPVLCIVCLLALFGRWNLLDLRSCIRILLIWVITIVSTATSSVSNWDGGGRSFLIFSTFYMLLGCALLQDITIKNILRFYAIVTLVISACVIFNLVFSIGMPRGRASFIWLGTRKDENYLAAYCTFGFVYYFAGAMRSQEGRKKKLVAALIIFTAIFATGSRAGLLSVMAAAVLLLVSTILSGGISAKKLGILFGIAVASAIGYLILRNTPVFARMTDSEGYADNIRLTIWKYAMEGFYVRPWFGSGIQAGTYYSQLHVRWVTHNCFVDMITTVGLVGTALYALEFLSFLNVQKGNRNFVLAVFFATALPLFFINGYETATFWMPMLICRLVCRYCKTHDFFELV